MHGEGEYVTECCAAKNINAQPQFLINELGIVLLLDILKFNTKLVYIREYHLWPSSDLQPVSNF